MTKTFRFALLASTLLGGARLGAGRDADHRKLAQR